MKMPLRALILVGLLAAACAAPVTVTPSPTAAPTVAVATTAATATATQNTNLACGPLVAFAADGDPRYLLTISSGETATRYRLSGSGTAPSDVGDLFAAKTPQLLTIAGRQITPNSADPQAINLTDFTVTRVTTCARP